MRKQFPERVSKLKQLWENWAEQNNVLPLQEGGATPRLERLRNHGSNEQRERKRAKDYTDKR